MSGVPSNEWVKHEQQKIVDLELDRLLFGLDVMGCKATEVSRSGKLRVVDYATKNGGNLSVIFDGDYVLSVSQRGLTETP
ncbi:MAG: hypothetical protein ACYC5H_16290 [Methylovirgula sp.]